MCGKGESFGSRGLVKSRVGGGLPLSLQVVPNRQDLLMMPRCFMGVCVYNWCFTNESVMGISDF